MCVSAGVILGHDLSTWVEWWGLPGLTLATFLAATVVPLSSEVVLLVALKAGLAPPAVLLWASVGNCAGALTSYALGRVFAPRAEMFLLRERYGQKALTWAHRYGAWCLVGSWLPGIGDPLRVAAGLVGLPLRAIVWVGFPVRVGRYVVLIWLFQQAGGR